MSDYLIWHEIRIKAPPAAVYEAVTNPKMIALWWIPDARGESAVGKTLEFWIGDFCQPMHVAALQPSRRVLWRASETGLADWRGTEVEFLLISGTDRTSVQLRHSGWSEGVAGLPYYSMSWAAYLASLKEFIEIGKGHPFPNPWLLD